jgi:23S rRNA (uridine2552-2'-O)-methyltransferase
MTRSSRRWVSEHRRDPYVKQAKAAHFRARSAYKLVQIQKKFRVIHPGDWVVDLGAAPGGWSQVAAGMVGKKGGVVAVDLLRIDPIPRVATVQGNVADEETVDLIRSELHQGRCNVILSDMAPSTSGIASVDHDRSVNLAESVLDLASALLAEKGRLVLKIFQGRDFKDIEKRLKLLFETCRIFKPPASRSRSVEIYLIGLKYRP